MNLILGINTRGVLNMTRRSFLKWSSIIPVAAVVIGTKKLLEPPKRKEEPLIEMESLRYQRISPAPFDHNFKELENRIKYLEGLLVV